MCGTSVTAKPLVISNLVLSVVKFYWKFVGVNASLMCKFHVCSLCCVNCTGNVWASRREAEERGCSYWRGSEWSVCSTSVQSCLRNLYLFVLNCNVLYSAPTCLASCLVTYVLCGNNVYGYMMWCVTEFLLRWNWREFWCRYFVYVYVLKYSNVCIMENGWYVECY